jgi:glycolate oxidase FAD binding subunit
LWGHREHRDPYFVAARESDAPLWRLSVKASAPYAELGGEQMIEWSGALRWLVAGERTDSARVRVFASENGGHATLFRASDKTVGAFHPLSRRHTLHRRLKAVFDPPGS